MSDDNNKGAPATLPPAFKGGTISVDSLKQTAQNMSEHARWNGGRPNPTAVDGGGAAASGAGASFSDTVNEALDQAVGAVGKVVDKVEALGKAALDELPALKGVPFEWPTLHKAPSFPEGGRLPTDLNDVLAKHNNADYAGVAASKAKKPCRKVLKISLFFDGTNNHEEADAAVLAAADPVNEKAEAMAAFTPYEQAQAIQPYQYPRTTNVARLFHASMGAGGSPSSGPSEHDRDLIDKGWFRYYMQGVGTRFKEVGDDDPGMAGEAFAKFGQARINWGLTRLCDALAQSGCFSITERLDNEKAREMVEAMNTAETRHATLKKYLTALKPQDNLPQLEGIQLYVVGFSRGAAQARTFVNWLLDYCQREGAAASQNQPAPEPGGKATATSQARRPSQVPPSAAEVERLRSIEALSRAIREAEAGPGQQPPAQPTEGEAAEAEAEPAPLLFHGVPIWVEMLGLFDTVASVGLSPAVPFTAGHCGWANGTMPLDQAAAAGLVKNCYHFVAAHEQRKSFSVDSLCVSGGYPRGNFQEFLYPGVHSDVGGGYPPGEQFRASLGMGHVLSQITLHDMYAKAWQHGMPLQVNAKNPVLVKVLEKSPQVQLEDFQIMTAEVMGEYSVEPELVARYNRWQASQTEAKLPEALAEQVHHVTAWRILRWVKGDYGQYLGLEGYGKEAVDKKKARARLIAAARKVANQGLDPKQPERFDSFGLDPEEYAGLSAAAFDQTAVAPAAQAELLSKV
ncbi:MAG: DUF2235 domain-containing protein, partial [Neisseriaceae bacterium]|nr:DUF2235 domain-containing protein [Neisseriaceae bacterium]